MIHSIESVGLWVTAALLPVGALLVVMYIRMLRLLRTQHNDVWVSLGSPRLWFARTTAETRDTLRFLWRHEYRALEDDHFSRLCEAVRILYMSFIALFIVAAMLLLVVALQRLGFAG